MAETQEMQEMEVTYSAMESPSFRTNWWRRRTRLEKGLIGLCVVVVIVLIAMVTITVVRGNQLSEAENGNAAHHKAQQGVCMSSDCVKTAARLLESMDHNVDPCDDFFEYACGSWNRLNVIPDDRANYNTFGKLRDEVQVTMKALLEQPIRDDEPEAIRHTKNLYTSCINITLIDERGAAPLREFLGELGGWPVLDPDWQAQDDFDWQDLVAELRKLNNRVLINLWVSADDKNSMENIVQLDQHPLEQRGGLDQTELGMPSRDYYLKGRAAKPLIAYEQFAKDVAKMLGADPVRAETEMREMVDFEIQLANYTIPSVDRRDAMAIYNKFTVGELYTNLTDKIDWLRFLNRIFAVVDIEFSRDDHVVVYAPSFMRNLAELIQVTPKRVLTNYLVWRIVSNRVSNLPQRFLDLRRDYHKALYGVDSERARWRTCITYVTENFGMAVGRLFVQDKFDEQAKKNALEMIENIRDAFNELLNEVTWMDSDTRKVAKEKANAIAEKIGYPDYIMNDTALNQDYENFVIHPDRYFENVIYNLRGVTYKDIKKLRHPVDKTKWSTTPAVVNAFYSSTKNQIMFPAGILQPPFYNKYFPKPLYYMMYSGGTIVAHEISHAFDDEGRQFDKDGNLVQWWSDSVIEAFKEKAQCIIDQYSNYTVEEVGMNINGKQTQGENIADNGGLKQAFRAYRKWVEKERGGMEEDLLPGIDLTHNQLFFLNFAQLWCGTARPQTHELQIHLGVHTAKRFRVIGTLSNSYDFAEAYQCPAGSKMNPHHKCVVW